MNLGIVAYCPPPGILNSDSFFQNITRSKAHYPLFIFSDSPKWNPSQLIKWPDFGGKKPHWAVNNWIFLTGLRIAKAAGLTHYIFCESDSRVFGDGWDAVVFDEYFARYPKGIACAGSPVCWDVNAGGREFSKQVVEMAWNYQQASGLPMVFCGSKSPTDCSGSAIYVNGSCAAYETAALLAIFAGFDVDLVHFSKHTTAFDLFIGRALWNYHGAKAINYVGWLTSVFSGYGDAVLNLAERKERLVSGKCRMIHQIKDNWVP